MLGLALRAASRGLLMELSAVRLRGEALLMALLVIQSALPLVRLSGMAARVAFVFWLVTFPFLIGITWVNRKQPGIAVIGVGLLLNFTVVVLNGGMPVLPSAVGIVTTQPGAAAIPSGDFVHVVGAAATYLPWLADVIPLPGPGWLRAVPSAGDLLLYVGVVAFIARARPSTSTASGRKSRIPNLDSE